MNYPSMTMVKCCLSDSVLNVLINKGMNWQSIQQTASEGKDNSVRSRNAKSY